MDPDGYYPDATFEKKPDSDPDPTLGKNGSGSYLIFTEKIDLLHLSYDIKVNIIDILIPYYEFGQ